MKKIFSIILKLRYTFLRLLLLLVLPIFGVYFVQNTSSKVEQSVNTQIGQTIKTIAFEQDSWISRTNQLLAVLSNVPVIVNADPQKCSDILDKVREIYPRYANFGVIDLGGDVLCSAIPFSGKISMEEKDAYLQQVIDSKDFSIGSFETDKIAKKPTIDFGYPVFDNQGNVKRVIFADLDLEWMKSLFDQVSFPAGSVLEIIDKNGLILYRNIDTESWVGKEIPDSQVLQQILRSNAGTAEAIGPDGINRVYAFTSLSGVSNEVFLVVGIPYSFVKTQTWQLTLPYIALILLSFLITLAIIKKEAKVFLPPAKKETENNQTPLV